MLSWSYNTFIAYLVVALAVSAVHASDEFQPTRRGHAHLKRMIRKREPQQEPPTVIPVIGAGQDPAENPPVTTTSVEVSTTAESTTAVSETTSTTASSTGASGIPDLVNTLLSGLVSCQHKLIYRLLTRCICGTGVWNHFSNHIPNLVVDFE